MKDLNEKPPTSVAIKKNLVQVYFGLKDLPEELFGGSKLSESFEESLNPRGTYKHFFLKMHDTLAANKLPTLLGKLGYNDVSKSEKLEHYYSEETNTSFVCLQPYLFNTD